MLPNRQALIGAVVEHVNRRVGLAGNLPISHTEMTTMVQQAFAGFDRVAPIIDELLSSTEGRRAPVSPPSPNVAVRPSRS